MFVSNLDKCNNCAYTFVGKKCARFFKMAFGEAPFCLSFLSTCSNNLKNCVNHYYHNEPSSGDKNTNTGGTFSHHWKNLTGI